MWLFVVGMMLVYVGAVAALGVVGGGLLHIGWLTAVADLARDGGNQTGEPGFNLHEKNIIKKLFSP